MDLFIHCEQEIKNRIDLIDQWLKNSLKDQQLPHGEPIQYLLESMKYSTNGGGKRFRPVLALLVGEMFNAPAEKVLPFACAVEMVHTYSLIHDDLPCMDNDDFRRGQPTNHKVYGEAFALLAGDSLLTEAFSVIAENYKDNAFLAMTLVQMLSKAAGIKGMVGGQALDLRGAKNISEQELRLLHELKTGALIQVAAEGAALIAGAKPSDIEHIRKFGLSLGLAFQVADDILDHQDKAQEGRSFVPMMGIDQTRQLLDKISDECHQSLNAVSRFPMLEYLVEFNQKREK